MGAKVKYNSMRLIEISPETWDDLLSNRLESVPNNLIIAVHGSCPNWDEKKLNNLRAKMRRMDLTGKYQELCIQPFNSVDEWVEGKTVRTTIKRNWYCKVTYLTNQGIKSHTVTRYFMNLLKWRRWEKKNRTFYLSADCEPCIINTNYVRSMGNE